MDMDFDRNKIQRILLNLLSNAVKYNYENGEVIVALDKITANGTENAQIQVADTGIGIKDENKDKIFDRFSRTTFYHYLYRKRYRSTYCERVCHYASRDNHGGKPYSSRDDIYHHSSCHPQLCSQ